MAINSKVIRLEILDYASLVTDINNNITAEEVGGFFVADVDIKPMVKNDGSTVLTVTIVYRK